MEDIKIEVVGITTSNEKEIANTSKEDLLEFGGHAANICYTPKDWNQVILEDKNNTIKRYESTLANNHHSVFDHSNISIYMTGVPKMIAMLINNEHAYNTSEKSARRTEMKPSPKEMELYNKWLIKLQEVIKSVYPNEKYLNDKTIERLARENARYMISVFTPTKIEYTVSFRQLNYLYGFANKMIQEETSNPLINMSKPGLEMFMNALRSTGYIDERLKDYRNRSFSLIKDNNLYHDQFGATYSTNYLGSFAEVAQQQRHRTLDYSISLPLHDTFYMPPIIKGNSELEKEWMNDIESVRDLFPQGMLLNVNERGKYEDFILKLQERLCTSVQLETCMQNKETLHKYVKTLMASSYIEDSKILDELYPYTKGARCMSGYHCPFPCHFDEGVKLTRKI